MIQVYPLLTQTPPNLIQILINTWFKTIDLIKFWKKTHYIHFKTRNSPSIDMKIDRNNKLIPNALFTKFLGLTIFSTLSWRIYVDHLTTKLSTKLSKLQRLACLGIMGVIWMTSTGAMEVLIVLPPLDLMIQRKARLAAHCLWSLGCWSYLHPQQGHSCILTQLQKSDPILNMGVKVT